MSMHDPGWDDAGFDSGGSGSGWSGDPSGPGGAGGPGGPGDPAGGNPGGPPTWQQPRVLAIAGGLVLVVIVVLAVLVIKQRTGSDDTAATPPPSRVSTSPSPKTSPTPTKPAFVTLDDWDAKADAVCTSYKAKLNTTEENVINHNQWKPYVDEYAAQIRAWEHIPLPTNNASVVQKFFDDSKGALSDAAAHNAAAFNASIGVADTYAGKMGMHVCNYGH